MAVRAKSDVAAATWGDNCQFVQWTGLTQATLDSGDPFQCPGAADRSVHVTGTLGAGGSVRIEGSNLANPTVDNDWFVLTDPQGNALNIAAVLSGKKIQETTRWIRPRVTAGDGTTNFTVTLLARRAV